MVSDALYLHIVRVDLVYIDRIFIAEAYVFEQPDFAQISTELQTV